MNPLRRLLSRLRGCNTGQREQPADFPRLHGERLATVVRAHSEGVHESPDGLERIRERTEKAERLTEVCWHEDNWCTGQCGEPAHSWRYPSHCDRCYTTWAIWFDTHPRGRHHAPPLRYGPELVVGKPVYDDDAAYVIPAEHMIFVQSEMGTGLDSWDF